MKEHYVLFSDGFGRIQKDEREPAVTGTGTGGNVLFSEELQYYTSFLLPNFFRSKRIKL
jgi:hypothetical protein